MVSFKVPRRQGSLPSKGGAVKYSDTSVPAAAANPSDDLRNTVCCGRNIKSALHASFTLSFNNFGPLPGMTACENSIVKAKPRPIQAFCLSLSFLNCKAALSSKFHGVVWMPLNPSHSHSLRSAEGADHRRRGRISRRRPRAVLF